MKFYIPLFFVLSFFSSHGIEANLTSIEVRGDSLEWHPESDSTLSLEMTEISSPSIGTLTTSEKWAVQKNGESFLASGSTTFTGIDGLKLTCIGSLEYEPKAHRIKALGKSPISIEKNGLFFTAKNGELLYHNSEIQSLTFSDSAKVHFEDFVASFEEAHFDYPSGSLTLFSKEGILTLSRKESSIPIQVEKVVVKKNLETSTFSIEGVGKVHFTIDDHQIDQLFKEVALCIRNLY